MSEPALKPLSIAEFLERDGDADQRYELLEGVPAAMAAPSRAHQVIAANLAYHLVGALIENSRCSVGVEAPVEIPERRDTCHIADLAVTCAPHTPDQRLVTEPLVLIEILSPSTEAYDRRTKLSDYRTLPSVQEIVLVDQRQLYCEVHRRLDNGLWLTDLLRWEDARLRLKSIDFDQPLSAIYAKAGLAGPLDPSR